MSENKNSKTVKCHLNLEIEIHILVQTTCIRQNFNSNLSIRIFIFSSNTLQLTVANKKVADKKQTCKLNITRKGRKKDENEYNNEDDASLFLTIISFYFRIFLPHISVTNSNCRNGEKNQYIKKDEFNKKAQRIIWNKKHNKTRENVHKF